MRSEEVELVEVSPRHYTLDKKHPLYTALSHTVVSASLSTCGLSHRLYDVSSITENHALFSAVIEWLAKRYESMGHKKPTHIIGVEAWGCIMASPLALRLGIPFVPSRRESLPENLFVGTGDGDEKPPNPLMSLRSNSIDAGSRVVVFDDFIDTGKTIDGVLDCVAVAKASVVEVVAVCDMIEAGGVAYIQRESPIKDLHILTFLRLQNRREVLFPPKKFKSRL